MTTATITKEEWLEKIAAIKLNSAYFANRHITKKIEVVDESWSEIKLYPDPNRKGHLCWIPF